MWLKISSFCVLSGVLFLSITDLLYLFSTMCRTSSKQNKKNKTNCGSTVTSRLIFLMMKSVIFLLYFQAYCVCGGGGGASDEDFLTKPALGGGGGGGM